MDTVIVVALLAFAAAFLWLALRCVPDAREVYWTGQGRPAGRGAVPLDRREGWGVLGDVRGGHARPSPEVARHVPSAATRVGEAPHGAPVSGLARPAASIR